MNQRDRTLCSAGLRLLHGLMVNGNLHQAPKVVHDLLAELDSPTQPTELLRLCLRISTDEDRIQTLQGP
jgi:hypothetical protein